MKFIIIIYTTNKLTVVEMEDIRGVRLRKFNLRKIVLGVKMHFHHTMTMRNQRLRRSKLNSLYSRRRAFEDDASSLLTTISSQFAGICRGGTCIFCSWPVVHENSLCASYAHTILLRGLLLIVINLNKPISCS